MTFQEACAHLGVETQRQWSAPAIARTTPALLGLFSWLILVAHCLRRERPLRPRRAAWYPKTVPTFSDVLADIRRLLWTRALPFSMSPADPDIQPPPAAAPSAPGRPLLLGLTHAPPLIARTGFVQSRAQRSVATVARRDACGWSRSQRR